MAEKRKKSKYQLKLRARIALANKVGGAFHSPTKDKDGKERRRLPFAMPVLQRMKAQKDAGLLQEVNCSFKGYTQKCVCDTCQKIFTITIIDANYQYEYNGSECDCESPFSKIEDALALEAGQDALEAMAEPVDDLDNQQIQCPKCLRWLASEAPICVCEWEEGEE